MLIREMGFVKLSFVPLCQAGVKERRTKVKAEFGLVGI